ncbi:MAG: SpoIIE family protein phosphatase [Spirochaetes bacterium]|nr:SpoIIE family protein phosphatase [Spirochaetota bacterium]
MSNKKTMTLEEILNSKYPPDFSKIRLSNEDLIRFFWKYRGLEKKIERNHDFWLSTNVNLKLAYERLDEKEQELEKAYEIIQEDLKIASQIQKSLLPEIPLEDQEPLDISFYHHQLTQVGGDYYDFFKTARGEDVIALFDIAGHGVGSALVMMYLKSLFIQAMKSNSSPQQIIEKVNLLSLPFLKKIKKYATFNFVLFTNHKITYVCGGGYGIHFHQDKTIPFIKRDHYLGLRKKKFHEFELPFVKNDVLVLFTDGLIEAQNDSEKSYSIQRLEEIVRSQIHKNASAIQAACIEDFYHFTPQNQDDITLIIIKKKD